MNKYISKEERENLSREVHPMPKHVEETLKSNNLIRAYQSRPAYQKNDYIGWITRAKREETQKKRLLQMIDELQDGTRYMRMKYTPS